MSKNSFKVKNGLTISPVDPANVVNPEAGDLIIDSTDSNKLKKYNADNVSFDEITGAGGGSGDLAPDIEDSTPTVSNVVAVKDAVTFLPIDANTESIKATFSGSNGSIRYQAPISADLVGVQGLVSFWIKTSVQNLSVYSTVAGVAESQLAAVTSNNKWKQYVIPTVLTAADHGFEILANGAVAGDVFIDDISIAVAPVGYTQGVQVVSAWEEFDVVNNISGATTNKGYVRSIGEDIEVRIETIFTGEPTQSGIFEYDLPSQFTAKYSIIDVTKRNIIGQGSLLDDGVANYPLQVALKSDNKINLLFKIEASETTNYIRTSNITGSEPVPTYTAGETINFSYKVTVNELSATPQAFISQKTGFPVVTGAGNAGQSITANVTDIPFIETEDKRGYWDGDSFTPTRVEDAGYYLVSGDIDHSVSTITGVDAYINGSLSKRIGALSGGTDHPFSGVVKIDKDESLTIRSTGSGTLTNNPNLHHIHIQKIPDEAYIAGLFSQIENVDATLTAETANVCNMSVDSVNNTIISQDVGCADGITITGTSGELIVNFPVGTYSKIPTGQCTSSNRPPATGVVCYEKSGSITKSTTQYPFQLINSSGTAGESELVNLQFSKQGADVNKSIKGAVINASQTMSDELKCLYNRYSEDEVKCGLWNGEQLYRRCFTIASDITTDDATITTWVGGLKIKNSINTGGGFYVVSGGNNDSSPTLARILYTESDGRFRSQILGTRTLGANTSICIEYTK